MKYEHSYNLINVQNKRNLFQTFTNGGANTPLKAVSMNCLNEYKSVLTGC